MILTQENLVYYLFERGLLTRDAVVNGAIEISEIPRRNRNFRVKQKNGPGYFLKQVSHWEPDSLRTLHAEAQCYRLATEDRSFQAIAGIVPRFHSFDQRRALLITELMDGAETVGEHHFRKASFPIEVAEQFGRTFGLYHREAMASPPPKLNGTFLRRPAWALSLHELLPQSAPNLSGGIYQMLGMVRQFPQFGAALEKLRTGWRFEVLIHGDIKWENCVLYPGSNGDLHLKVVDWEMADWGDSCWDLAGIVSAFLFFWVQSLPANNMATPDVLLAQARFPIETMQPAIQSFWKTYSQTRGLSPQETRDLLLRTVSYTGARNIQTAFEMLQHSPVANSSTVLLLQLTMNILANPELASRELLGIEA